MCSKEDNNEIFFFYLILRKLYHVSNNRLQSYDLQKHMYSSVLLYPLYHDCIFELFFY